MAYEYESQLALVGAGFAAAVLPRLGRCVVPDNVKVLTLRPLLVRRLYAVWRTEAARRPAIRATVDALRAVAPPPPLELAAHEEN
jgi:DNA-binding transcriptional LysR family regulator